MSASGGGGRRLPAVQWRPMKSPRGPSFYWLTSSENTLCHDSSSPQCVTVKPKSTSSDMTMIKPLSHSFPEEMKTNLQSDSPPSKPDVTRVLRVSVPSFMLCTGYDLRLLVLTFHPGPEPNRLYPIARSADMRCTGQHPDGLAVWNRMLCFSGLSFAGRFRGQLGPGAFHTKAGARGALVSYSNLLMASS